MPVYEQQLKKYLEHIGTKSTNFRVKAEGERVGATLSWDESVGRLHRFFCEALV